MVTYDILFVVSTYLDTDAENHLLLRTEIMRRRLVRKIVTLCIRVKLLLCPEWEYEYKNYRFAYNRLCLRFDHSDVLQIDFNCFLYKIYLGIYVQSKPLSLF